MLTASVSFLTAILIYLTLFASFAIKPKTKTSEILEALLAIFQWPLSFLLSAIILEIVALWDASLWFHRVALFYLAIAAISFAISLVASVKYLTFREYFRNYKWCPECNTLVQEDVKVCPHCNYDFNSDVV